jgi:hypothetical protein
MKWANGYIEKLQKGETVQFRPRGHSMTGKINHKDLVEVAPCWRTPLKGDVVLCRVGGNDYLHLVSAVQGDRFQISNNSGWVNGWITQSGIFGILKQVNPAKLNS